LTALPRTPSSMYSHPHQWPARLHPVRYDFRVAVVASGAACACRRSRHAWLGKTRGQTARHAASVAPHAHAIVEAPCAIPPVYEIDAASRRSSDASPWDDHGVRYYSLEKLFPEAPGLADAFDEDAEFRAQLRWATREDLYDPIARFSKKVNERLKGMDGTLLCALRPPQKIEEPRRCAEMTKVLNKWGLGELSGATFIERLFSLCGELSFKVQDREKASGSFSDIVTRGGGDHRWHQDSGWDKSTVLMGFPPESRWQGVGTFSHIARLSHPLPVPDKPIPVVFSEMVCVGQRIPEDYIFRPVYCKGAEIVTYNDSKTMHSAPDRIDRESLWRLQ